MSFVKMKPPAMFMNRVSPMDDGPREGGGETASSQPNHQVLTVEQDNTGIALIIH